MFEMRTFFISQWKIKSSQKNVLTACNIQKITPYFEENI